MSGRGPRIAVVGPGAMRWAIGYHLAGRRARVLWLETYGAGHDRGFSHGGWRAIHRRYYEDREYVPLVTRALELWRRPEPEVGQRLPHLTGCLVLGPPDTRAVRGAQASSRKFEIRAWVMTALRLAVDRLDPNGIGGGSRDRLRDPERGSVGAGRRSLDLDPPSRVAPAAGGGAPLMIWLRPARAEAFALDRVPPFLYQWGDSHACCGFPALDGRTVKVAQRQCGDVATASGVDRGHSHQEVAAMRDRVAEVVPGLRAAAPDRAGVGLYTNTPDGNFTVGPHPRCDRVLAACGFSGPEFKFAPVVGVAMADPVLEGETTREPGPLAGARTAPGRP